jgi:hypothetical protein
VDIRNSKFFKIKYWAIILVVQFLLFYILSRFGFAIHLFSNLFEWKKKLHISLFSAISWSVGDVIYIATTLLFFYLLLRLIITKKAIFLKYILITANITYFVYQCFWGMLYFQQPVIEKLGNKKISEEAIQKLAVKYLYLCKATREKLSEDDHHKIKIDNVRQLETEIIAQQKNLPQFINKKIAVSNISVKPSLFDSLMNKTGIYGYYNPFTAEAQYNPNIPASQLPFTLAHEMSHQLGYAREQEASFIAYLCARNSANKELQYSVQLYVLKSLLKALAVKNPSFVKNILEQYSPKMKLDRLYEQKFFISNEGIVSDFFGITNDLFLKSNQQAGSVTYSYFIHLVLLYEL